jgi:hypothetical protein
MSAKKLLMMAGAVVVLAVYYYLYQDYFARGAIQISVTQRQPNNSRFRIQPGGPAPSDEEILAFRLGQDYQLTDIQVVSRTAGQSGKPASPLWHVVSEAGSPPTRSFIYGHSVPGMHSLSPGAAAERLLPGTGYRILVEAGSIKAAYDFQTPAENLASQ